MPVFIAPMTCQTTSDRGRPIGGGPLPAATVHMVTFTVHSVGPVEHKGTGPFLRMTGTTNHNVRPSLMLIGDVRRTAVAIHFLPEGRCKDDGLSTSGLKSALSLSI